MADISIQPASAKPVIFISYSHKDEPDHPRDGYCPFILPMSGGSWKSTTGIIPISAARSWCVAWSSARQANSVVCKGRQASWYRLPVGCSIPWFVRE
jgi:hypothetical protein